MTTRGALLLLWAGGLAAGGCGGGGGASGPDGAAGNDGGDGGPPAACGEVQPCGGDLVGTWTFAEICESAAHTAARAARFSAMAADAWCPEQTLVGVNPTATGSWVFAADGTYTLDLVFGGTLDIDFPASCLVGLSCDDLTTELQYEIGAVTFPLPTVSAISCSGASSCLCRATVEDINAESGSYSVSGSVLTFVTTIGVAADSSYCVQKDALHILTTSTGPTGAAVVDSDLVATKP